MDYLVYIEHSAENLQFFLWYQGYIVRFNCLPSHQRALSPEWIPETIPKPNLTIKGHINYSNRRNGDAFALMMQVDNPRESTLFCHDPARPLSIVKNSDASAVARSFSSTTAEIVEPAEQKWQPFTIQPMRDEINRMMRHYLAFNAPRELNISHKDRALCLHALQHTTHPSAILPALAIATAALQGQSHPNFIRWSICNGNKPRVIFVRGVGILQILIGFSVATLLTFSSVSRWWRVFASIGWFFGISTCVAAYKGLCVVLHYKGHGRMVRPWQEPGEGSEFDELPSMQAFGSKNPSVNDQQSWHERYKRKGWWKNVFERTVWTQDKNLRVLQDRIVLGANVWAILLTIGLTIGFVAVPEAGLF